MSIVQGEQDPHYDPDNDPSLDETPAPTRYLVVITEQMPYGFECDSLAEAVEALNREAPTFGGFVLVQDRGERSWTDAGVTFDDDTETYITEEV